MIFFRKEQQKQNDASEVELTEEELENVYGGPNGAQKTILSEIKHLREKINDQSTSKTDQIRLLSEIANLEQAYRELGKRRTR